MADDATATQAAPSPEELQVAATEASMAEERAVAEAAAAEFASAQQSQEQAGQEAKSERPRGPDGKFLPTKQTAAPEPTAETTPAESPPKVSTVWAEAARQAGFNDDDIAKFTSDADVQQQLTTRYIGSQIQALQTLGIDPGEFQRYVQWRQQGAAGQPAPQPAAPQPQPTVVTSLDDLNLDIDEKTVDPEVAAQTKSIVEYVNRLKATLVAENQKLREQVTGLDGQVKQSAEAVQAAQREAREAAAWEQAAAAVPGFTEYFGGKPSDLKRLAQANPNHPRVQDAVAFDQYLLPKLDEYVRILGDTERARQLALQDAWEASPFSKVAVKGNGQGKSNGTNGYGPGSVPRSAPRRGSNAVAAPKDDDVQAEYDRLMGVVGDALDRAGGDMTKIKW